MQSWYAASQPGGAYHQPFRYEDLPTLDGELRPQAISISRHRSAFEAVERENDESEADIKEDNLPKAAAQPQRLQVPRAASASASIAPTRSSSSGAAPPKPLDPSSRGNAASPALRGSSKEGSRPAVQPGFEDLLDSSQDFPVKVESPKRKACSVQPGFEDLLDDNLDGPPTPKRPAVSRKVEEDVKPANDAPWERVQLSQAAYAKLSHASRTLAQREEQDRTSWNTLATNSFDAHLYGETVAAIEKQRVARARHEQIEALKAQRRREWERAQAGSGPLTERDTIGALGMLPTATRKERPLTDPRKVTRFSLFVYKQYAEEWIKRRVAAAAKSPLPWENPSPTFTVADLARASRPRYVAREMARQAIELKEQQGSQSTESLKKKARKVVRGGIRMMWDEGFIVHAAEAPESDSGNQTFGWGGTAAELFAPTQQSPTATKKRLNHTNADDLVPPSSGGTSIAFTAAPGENDLSDDSEDERDASMQESFEMVTTGSIISALRELHERRMKRQGGPSVYWEDALVQKNYQQLLHQLQRSDERFAKLRIKSVAAAMSELTM